MHVLGFPDMMWWFILLSLLMTVYVNASDDDDEKVFGFNVKPGGELLSFQEERDGVTCRFSYRAQGGTNEDWNMIISLNEKKEYICTVERPSGQSYLFFQSFELQVIGAQALDGMVFGPRRNGRDTPLKDEEYKINLEEGKITHVEGKFSSQLDKVILKALETKKQEL